MWAEVHEGYFHMVIANLISIAHSRWVLMDVADKSKESQLMTAQSRFVQSLFGFIYRDSIYVWIRKKIKLNVYVAIYVNN